MKINAEAIKQFRIDNGLTQNDVAIRLGITEATVSRYESKKINKVSPSVLLGYQAGILSNLIAEMIA